MPENDKQANVGLLGPIESGQTAAIPTPPEPGQEILSDYFVLESDVFDQKFLTNIILPKFILSTTNSIKEKSFILLTFHGSHSPSVYANVLHAAKVGIKKFNIHFTNEDEGDTISLWAFEGVRVHAVDFGYVARQRTEMPMISVELAYDSISIDDITF
jgi:hypothetical protein